MPSVPVAFSIPTDAEDPRASEDSADAYCVMTSPDSFKVMVKLTVCEESS